MRRVHQASGSGDAKVVWDLPRERLVMSGENLDIDGFARVFTSIGSSTTSRSSTSLRFDQWVIGTTGCSLFVDPRVGDAVTNACGCAVASLPVQAGHRLIGRAVGTGALVSAAASLPDTNAAEGSKGATGLE